MRLSTVLISVSYFIVTMFIHFLCGAVCLFTSLLSLLCGPVCVCVRDFYYLFVCVWLSISSGEVFARGDCSYMCLFHFCMYTLYDIYVFVHFCVYVYFAH